MDKKRRGKEGQEEGKVKERILEGKRKVERGRKGNRRRLKGVVWRNKRKKEMTEEEVRGAGGQ